MTYYPLKIYLDNNIFISLEKGEIAKDDVEKFIGDHNQSSNEFIYSLAHIYETDTITSYGNNTKDELLNSQLHLISDITNNVYYEMHSDEKLYAYIISHFEAYKSVKDFPKEDDRKYKFCDNMSFESRAVFRKSLKIDTQVLNNLSANEVINYLNSKYQEAGVSMNFTETYFFALKEIQNEASSKKINLYDKIAILFGMLDNVGYYKDKENAKSDYARIWDSNHAYYASYADIYITNDKRAKMKTEIAYSLLDINTKVLNLQLKY